MASPKRRYHSVTRSPTGAIKQLSSPEGSDHPTLKLQHDIEAGWSCQSKSGGLAVLTDGTDLPEEGTHLLQHISFGQDLVGAARAQRSGWITMKMGQPSLCSSSTTMAAQHDGLLSTGPPCTRRAVRESNSAKVVLETSSRPAHDPEGTWVCAKIAYVRSLSSSFCLHSDLRSPKVKAFLIV